MKRLAGKFLAVASIVTLSLGLDIPNNHVVSTKWLQKNLTNKELVIIDTRKPKEYKAGHIKGAVNYPKGSFFKGKLGTIPKLYTPTKEIERLLKNAGVTDDSTVVFYSAGKKNKDFADAASGVWNLWLYGFKKSAVLNGGYTKWVSEKRKITTSTPKIKKSDIELDTFDRSIIAGLPDIIGAIYNDDIQITDARTAKFYRGEDKRKDLKRHGRIPTAKLTPVIRYVKKTKNFYEFLSPKEARKTLYNGGFGIELDKPLIIYCNTGHKARGLWFVAKFIAGLKDVRVFDGSMVEYSRSSFPVDTGEPME